MVMLVMLMLQLPLQLLPALPWPFLSLPLFTSLLRRTTTVALRAGYVFPPSSRNHAGLQ
ncbi:MAG: hypothetical protein AVDCRST_MAG71-1692 [uncultured Lysobacter sp.]|uniref:Uncharacterized protein n=1 Tax=uncultured Lysobacter sp. TaxID=271060 RepID=A0A6J4LI93_9GAMM|nr:MAG: hypothetical protein AVDCRST_MAG71-1692 [uncultured Lysobacter sp.]